jgi:hypothetical protein
MHILPDWIIHTVQGIAHTEVLEEIEKLVEKHLIQSIQITEKNCIVTVFDPDTKHIILTRGIETDI